MTETAKMPERIWALEKHGPYRLSCSILDHSEPEFQAVEYVRADLLREALDLAEQLNSPLEARDQHFLREPASEKIAELRRLAGENNG